MILICKQQHMVSYKIQFTVILNFYEVYFMKKKYVCPAIQNHLEENKNWAPAIVAAGKAVAAAAGLVAGYSLGRSVANQSRGHSLKAYKGIPILELQYVK